MRSLVKLWISGRGNAPREEQLWGGMGETCAARLFQGLGFRDNGRKMETTTGGFLILTPPPQTREDSKYSGVAQSNLGKFVGRKFQRN